LLRAALERASTSSSGCVVVGPKCPLKQDDLWVTLVNKILIPRRRRVFWDIADVNRKLQEFGVSPVWARISDLSWVVTSVISPVVGPAAQLTASATSEPLAKSDRPAVLTPDGGHANLTSTSGEVAERLNAPVSKTG
jgi:hypothetical protein